MTSQESPTSRRRLPNTGFVEKRRLNIPLHSDPQAPAPYDKSDLAAFKALREGRADPHQQQLCLEWIIQACGTYEDPWRAGGPEGARATDLACGKRLIGIQVVKLINMPTIGKENSEQGEQG